MSLHDDLPHDLEVVIGALTRLLNSLTGAERLALSIDQSDTDQRGRWAGCHRLRKRSHERCRCNKHAGHGGGVFHGSRWRFVKLMTCLPCQ